MADHPVRVRVVVTDDEGVTAPPRVVTLPVELGRDPEHADLPIAGPGVAGRHARLEPDGDGVAVVDLGGHGTWVGGERVGRRPLAGDDVVSLGTSTVVCTVVPPAPRPGPRPEQPARPRPPARSATTFGTTWAVAFDDGALTPIPLRGLAAAWVRTTRSAAALGTLLPTGSPGPADRLTAHEAVGTSLDTFLAGDFRRLGNLTVPFCRPDRPVDVVSRHVLRMRTLPAYRATRAAYPALRAEIDRPGSDPEASARITTLLGAEDRRFIVRAVTALRRGVAAFEQHGAAVIDEAGDELLGHLKAVLGLAAVRDLRAMAHLRLAGFVPDAAGDSPRGEDAHSGEQP